MLDLLFPRSRPLAGLFSLRLSTLISSSARPISRSSPSTPFRYSRVVFKIASLEVSSSATQTFLGTFAAVDDCYCRGDLQLVANEWLSSCIDELCTLGDNGVNLANAASIYTGYCNDRGFTALPAQNSASTTQATSRSTTSTNTRNLSTSTNPAEEPETTPNNDSSNNKTLEIALAVVGGIAGLAIIIAAVFFRKIRQKRRQQNPVDLPTYPNNYGYMSTQQLRPSDLHRLSAETLGPPDSYSVANMPAYTRPLNPPHPAPPSLVSTARPLR
ncbi:hypothetical protein PV10_07606 [Exophiala mesophila]|uniref:Uncharacterized protein n=1 Tax=Exophiala mesophila TaxID=212818 RepID=A0A0D1Z613_EXOME|nr:uncharacterized protein PV10_07606 [Exophiala mesophila]KIV90287.1 hypothetical protein PV10_07606 [Exophiala mesophila]